MSMKLTAKPVGSKFTLRNWRNLKVFFALKKRFGYNTYACRMSQAWHVILYYRVRGESHEIGAAFLSLSITGTC